MSGSPKFFVRRLYYTPDLGIPEESVLVGLLLLDAQERPIDFRYRELARTDAPKSDRLVINGTLLEIDEANHANTLERMYEKHLRHLSLNLTMTPIRELKAVCLEDAEQALESLFTSRD